MAFSQLLLLFVLSMFCAQSFWDLTLSICGEDNHYWIFTLYGTVSMFLWYSMVNIPFALIDFIQPNWANDYKIQDKKTVTWAKYRTTFPLIVFNTCVVGFTMSSLFYPLLAYTGVSFSREIPSVLNIFRDIFLCVFVEEAGFYYTHRLFHQPFFYKNIHKLHHRWTAPVSITSVYCHPIEHAFSNLFPILLGPTLLGSHVITFWLWFAVAIASTTVSHCGYHFPILPSSEQHDYHHYAFNENFGVLGILDTLHGTNKTFRKSAHGLRNRTYFGRTPIKQVYPEKVE